MKRIILLLLCSATLVYGQAYQPRITAASIGAGDAQTANPLSQFAATTSLQIKGVVSDETGSGALVFGTNPTINGFSIASGASLILDTDGTLTANSDAKVASQKAALTLANTRALLLPANFIPTSIPGCKIWLRADSLSALNDGDLVSTWTEEAVGRNATASSTARPTYKTNVLNGRNAVRFNGTANAMTLSGVFDSSVDTSVTVFVVYGNIAQTLDTSVILSSGAGVYIARQNDGTYAHIGGISSDPRGIAYNSCSIERVEYSNSSINTYQYGLKSNTSAGGTTSSGFASGNLVIGSFAGSFWWNGDVSEVIIYSGILTSDQSRAVENYLAAKYTASQSRIVCVGDSLTSGYGTPDVSYPGYLAELLGVKRNILRAAILGSVSSDLLTSTRKSDILLARSNGPDWLFIWAGTNDKGTLTAAQSYANIAAIAAYGKRCGYQTLVFTMLPRSTDSDDTFRTTFNGLIRTNYLTVADAICDIGADATLGVKGAENNATYYADGTHLTAAGYLIVANLAISDLGVTGTAGTPINDSAAIGMVGEIISSAIVVGSATSLTTATAKNVTSISLTAGDWDVEGNVNFTETTATASARSAGITSTSATVPVDGTESYCGVQSTITSELNSITLPRKRVSLAATTTIYLVGKATFSAGTVSGFGSISARRVR